MSTSNSIVGTNGQVKPFRLPPSGPFAGVDAYERALEATHDERRRMVENVKRDMRDCDRMLSQEQERRKAEMKRAGIIANKLVRYTEEVY